MASSKGGKDSGWRLPVRCLQAPTEFIVTETNLVNEPLCLSVSVSLSVSFSISFWVIYPSVKLFLYISILSLFSTQNEWVPPKLVVGSAGKVVRYQALPGFSWNLAFLKLYPHEEEEELAWRKFWPGEGFRGIPERRLIPHTEMQPGQTGSHLIFCKK